MSPVRQVQLLPRALAIVPKRKGKKMVATRTTQNNVSERAVLIRLRISTWEASKRDKRASEEICQIKGAQDDVARVFVQLCPKEELDPVMAKRRKVKSIWLKYTLPWLDEGVRILPTSLFQRYSKEMRDALAEFDDEVEAFLKRYPRIAAREAAKKRLADFLNDNPLPSKELLKEKFGVKQNFVPFPDVEDFRLDLNENMVAKIKQESAAAFKASTQLAINSLYDKLYKMVKRVADTLKDKDTKFHNTMISNIKDICKLLPDLNINKDSKLEELRKEIEAELAGKDCEVLKKNLVERKKTAKTAKDIMKKINQFKNI